MPRPGLRGAGGGEDDDAGGGPAIVIAQQLLPPQMLFDTKPSSISKFLKEHASYKARCKRSNVRVEEQTPILVLLASPVARLLRRLFEPTENSPSWEEITDADAAALLRSLSAPVTDHGQLDLFREIQMNASLSHESTSEFLCQWEERLEQVGELSPGMNKELVGIFLSRISPPSLAAFMVPKPKTLEAAMLQLVNETRRAMGVLEELHRMGLSVTANPSASRPAERASDLFTPLNSAKPAQNANHILATSDSEESDSESTHPQVRSVECFYCHKKGHKQSVCYKKQRDEAARVGAGAGAGVGLSAAGVKAAQPWSVVPKTKSVRLVSSQNQNKRHVPARLTCLEDAEIAVQGDAMLDTGADCNVLRWDVAKEMAKQGFPVTQLRKPVTLGNLGPIKVQARETITAEVSIDWHGEELVSTEDFFVVDHADEQVLLSFDACSRLGVELSRCYRPVVRRASGDQSPMRVTQSVLRVRAADSSTGRAWCVKPTMVSAQPSVTAMEMVMETNAVIGSVVETLPAMVFAVESESASGSDERELELLGTSDTNHLVIENQVKGVQNVVLGDVGIAVGPYTFPEKKGEGWGRDTANVLTVRGSEEQLNELGCVGTLQLGTNTSHWFAACRTGVGECVDFSADRQAVLTKSTEFPVIKSLRCADASEGLACNHRSSGMGLARDYWVFYAKAKNAQALGEE